MDPILQNVLWLAGFGAAGFGAGFFLGKVGLTTLKTDLTNLESMFKKSTVTVTPPSTVHVNVTPTPTPNSVPVAVHTA